LANQIHYGSAEAERLTAESKRLIEESGMAAKRMQKDADKRLGKTTSINRDYNRIQQDQKLEENVQEIKVLGGRRRVSIDLVHDEVGRELMKEREVIEGVASLLNRTLEQTNEQIRLNRSAKYYLEKDLRDKQSRLMVSAPSSQTPPRILTTPSPTSTSSKQSARRTTLCLRVLLESLLEQMSTDMCRQHNATGNALWLQETKTAKGQLEDHLAKVLSEVASRKWNLEALRLAIEDKAGPLKVAQTRLSARSQRPSIELCHDPELTAHIKSSLPLLCVNPVTPPDCEMELLALTRSQLILEEEIQVKSHSLYIDEVVCTQLRWPIAINSF
uniref:Tektin n=1 Tax=Hucho hucho TaxID=62062 RepID=A0A4W5P446_9TELE